jgi:hypothetical protein
MKRFVMTITIALMLLPARADAVVLRGHMPLHQGMYWNFIEDGSVNLETWAVNGSFTQKGIGDTIMFISEGAVLHALRREWDGIYCYAEYGPDGFRIPDEPQLFLPLTIEFDQQVKRTVTYTNYSAGEGVSETGTTISSVTFTLQKMEDLTYHGQEIRNCAVIEKKTRESENETTEKFWLVPTIGPIKREKTHNGTTTVYTLASSGGNQASGKAPIPLEDYFPFAPGNVRTYTESGGNTVEVLMQASVSKGGYTTMPYVEGDGDTNYLMQSRRGIELTMKYVPLAGFAFMFLPPDQPVILLPPALEIGLQHNSVSYYRPGQWPSLTPMLDFYSEMRVSSIPVCIEDVTTPAGLYRNCVKICLISVSKAFAMQREKIRVGFIWLAKDTGIVKQESISISNTFHPLSPLFVYNIQRWKLAKIEQRQLLQPVASPSKQSPTTSREEPYTGTLTWQDNSTAMFDKTVSSAPFFVRTIVKKQLHSEIRTRVADDGRVTEEILIKAVRGITPERQLAKIMKTLEGMRTR